MLRYVDSSPMSAEFTAVFEFDYRFNLGVAYRYNESFAGLVFFEVSPSVDLGYAYEIAGQDAQFNLNNTHELVLRIKLRKNEE